MRRPRERTVHHRVMPASRPQRVKARTGAERVQIGRFRLFHREILIVVLALAAVLRFAGIGWGDNYYLHPDERFMTMVTIDTAWPGSVAEYFDTESSPLNPFNSVHGSYVYGTLPLFLAKLLGTITNDVVYGDAHLPGRWLSAVSDIGTVALTFWIARRLFSSTAGLIAAALVAFTPLHIQTAHYYTTDSMSTFFAVATFAATLQAWHRRSWVWFAVAGLCVGFAGASKPNLLLAAGFVVVPVLETIRLHGWRSLLPPWRLHASSRRDAVRFPIVLGVVLAGLMALFAFRVAQPYAFLGPNPLSFRLDPRWTDTLDYWRRVQSGVIDVPPGVQWADRTPVVFILDNLVRWGMGPALSLAALISLAMVSYRLVARRRWPSWWLLAIVAWVLFHIVFYGTSLSKTQRYLLPAYPFLIMLAAGQLEALSSRIGSSDWRGRLPVRLSRLPSLRPPGAIRWGTLITALVIGGTMFSGIALTNIYLQPHSRVTASEWIYENIPASSVLTSEHWDDGLPIGLPEYPGGQYTHVQLELYNGDTDAKLSKLIGQLHRADYIVLSSDRLVETIPRQPDRYPMTTAYYDALESGELGFELVADFESPPTLFGIELDDRDAEEALTVYDHPYVRIFEKTDAWSTHDAWYFLDNALGDGGVNRRTIDLPQSSMMASEQDRIAFTESGTWSDMFDPGGIANAAPVLWWYLVVQLFALPAIPIMWRLFPTLPDRGYALAKTVGVFGIAWIGWMLASLRLVEFGRPGLLLALLLAALLGVVVAGFRFRPVVDDLRQRWRWVAATEALFMVAFGAMVWLRALNPDLWHPARGGEKPMELAIFNAILRSPNFPPFDPWFAGGTLHYYYFGYVPWASISRLTGILPEIAFNLALPSVYALLLLNVWIAAAALIGRMSRADRPEESPPRDAGTRWRPILLALAAPVFVGIFANLDFARRIGRGEWGYTPAPSWLDPLGDLGHIGWGIWNSLTEVVALPTDTFWAPTRVIPNTINEFPYFSFLFGDLHAHVLAMPVIAAVIVVAISVAIASNPGTSTHDGAFLGTIGGWRRMAPVAVLGGFLAGILYSTNTWDYPPAIALLVAGAAISAVVRFGISSPWLTVRDVAIFAVIVLVSGRVLFQPYINHYGSLPVESSSALEITRLPDYLTIHGVMLWAIAAYVAIEVGRVIWMLWQQSQWGGITAILILFAIGTTYTGVFMAGNTALFLIVGMLTLALCACGRPNQPGHLIVFAMIGLAFGLALVPEVFRLANDVGRMNLVFKLYLYAWQLLGVSAAVAAVQVVLTIHNAGRLMLARAVAPGGTTIAEHGPQPGLGTSSIVASTGSASWSARGSIAWTTIMGVLVGRLWMVVMTIFIVGALSYPVLVTGPRLDDRFSPLDPMLDGLAYMGEAVWAAGPPEGPSVTFPLANDREAIRWLRQNVEGSPVILEAQLPAYQWGGRISSITGLPTVLGWTWHQIQQRPGYSEQVNQRVEDVATIYGDFGSFESVAPILERYHVELIYVGDLERALYGEQALSKFGEAVEQGELQIVYQESGVTIYAYPGSSPEMTTDE